MMATAVAAISTATQVVGLARKVQAMGSRISWVAAAGPRLQRRPRSTPRATNTSSSPYASTSRATAPPTAARLNPIWLSATAPKTMAASDSTPISTPATMRGAGREEGAPTTRLL